MKLVYYVLRHSTTLFRIPILLFGGSKWASIRRVKDTGKRGAGHACAGKEVQGRARVGEEARRDVRVRMKGRGDVCEWAEGRGDVRWRKRRS